MKGAVVLLSGGMDSTTLLHHVVRELGRRPVFAVSFLYGQKHSRELEMARWQAEAAGVEEHVVADLSFMKTLLAGKSALLDDTAKVPDLSALSEAERSQPPTYVPNRNLIFLSVAVAQAEAKAVPEVFYGAQAQDEYGYWDCTHEFVEKLNEVLSLNRRLAVTVRAPFVGMKKADVLRIGLLLGVDYSRTWSCYRGGRAPCGTCPTCVERAAAFRAVDAPDPLLCLARKARKRQDSEAE